VRTCVPAAASLVCHSAETPTSQPSRQQSRTIASVQHVCKDTLDVQEHTLESQARAAAQHNRARKPELDHAGCVEHTGWPLLVPEVMHERSTWEQLPASKAGVPLLQALGEVLRTAALLAKQTQYTGSRPHVACMH
jgi:hypothetical protein